MVFLKRPRFLWVCAGVALMGALPATVSAQWLTLFEAPAAEVEAFDSGREAFSAFGCVECHSGVTDKSYQSGFRVLGSAKSSAQSLMYADIMRLGLAPSGRAGDQNKLSNQAPSQSTLRLGEREYRQAKENSAVFLRYLHGDVQGAQSSLMLFEHADESERRAVIDYVLMF